MQKLQTHHLFRPLSCETCFFQPKTTLCSTPLMRNLRVSSKPSLLSTPLMRNLFFSSNNNTSFDPSHAKPAFFIKKQRFSFSLFLSFVLPFFRYFFLSLLLFVLFRYCLSVVLYLIRYCFLSFCRYLCIVFVRFLFV